MKYYETPHRKNRRSGLIVAAALCLVAVGALLWQITAADRVKKAVPKSVPLPQVSYSDNTSSYTDTTEPPTDSSDVAGSVEEVPYESESKPAEEPKPKAPAYVLPLEGKIIKHHSDTALQYSATYGDLRLHNGVDIAAKSGATVVCAAGGTVTGFEENALLGQTVTVDHGDGIVVRYCGLDHVEVSTGDRVICGQTLGVVGTVPSECADEPHLHLEITKDGKPVSPEDLF